MSYVARYHQYLTAREYVADTLGEAIAFLMEGEDAGRLSSDEIVDRTGKVVINDYDLRTIYTTEYNVIPLSEIVAKRMGVEIQKLGL